MSKRVLKWRRRLVVSIEGDMVVAKANQLGVHLYPIEDEASGVFWTWESLFLGDSMKEGSPLRKLFRRK